MLCVLTGLEFRAVLLSQDPELNYRLEPCGGLNEIFSIAFDVEYLVPIGGTIWGA